VKDSNSDLKKFITQTITQAIAQSEERMKKFVLQTVADSEERLRNEIKILRQEFSSKHQALQTEMREGFAGVAEAFENFSTIREEDRKYIDKTFARHDREITRLQKRTV
jgi:hypothetical protein